MPIFTLDNKKIFYAHVPKTGGTYVEDFFRKNGFTVHFWSSRPAEMGLSIPPQHWHSDIYEKIISPDDFDARFMTVRHPIDRLISEYRSTLRQHGNNSFQNWLNVAETGFRENQAFNHNHLRPQSHFHSNGLWVYKCESKFDKYWARSLGQQFAIEVQNEEVKSRRNTEETVNINLDPDDLKAAVSFCERYYKQDYIQFDYKPSDAAVFRKYKVDPEKLIRRQIWQIRLPRRRS